MPDSAPLPALPTPRGVLHASMISASTMALSSFLDVVEGVLNQGESGVNVGRLRCSVSPRPAGGRLQGEAKRSHPRRVLRDHVAVEACAEFWRADLRVEVHVIEAKTLVEPVDPFEIVHQAPEEIAAHRDTFIRRAL